VTDFPAIFSFFSSNKLKLLISKIDLQPLIELSTRDFNSTDLKTTFTYADYRSFNFLMLAAEQGNVAALKHFLNIGMDVNSTVNHETAAKLAHFGGHYGALVLLLQHNSLFPPKFNAEQTDNDELQMFILATEEFHERLNMSQRDEMTRLARENPHLRHFYSIHNVSAPTAALSAKNLDLYEFLITLNITVGPFEMLEDAIDSLNEQEKLQLRAIHERHAKCLPEKHLMILEASSYVGHDEHNFDNKMALVRQAYADLNAMELIRPLLMLIAAARCFKVVFDFNSDSVQRMDPTSDRDTKGLFYVTRHIFIGAKGLLVMTTRANVLGIIVHELCHYAMIIVFDNHSKPYRKEQLMTVGKEFNTIVNQCQRDEMYEEIIKHAFGYPAYQRRAELIVRAPQLIAHYSDNEEKFTQVRDIYENLFKFYEQRVLPEVKSATENTQKLAEEAIQSFAYGMRRKVSMWKKISIAAAFALPFAMLLVYFLVYTRSFTCESLTDEERTKMNASTIEYFGTNVTFGEFFNTDSAMCGNLTSESIEKLVEDGHFNYTQVEKAKIDNNVDFSWKNLAPELRTKLLNSTVNFQASYVQFYDLLGLNFTNSDYSEQRLSLNKNRLDLNHNDHDDDEFSYKILKHMTPAQIRSILQGETFEIGEKIRALPSFYYERNFTHNRNAYKSLTEICQMSSLILLADSAGSGKTTVFMKIFSKIKELWPTAWTFYVDLKEHLESFEKYNLLKPFELKDFLVNILNLKKFDAVLFKNFVATRKIVLLWDGVDEISPKYKEFMIELIQRVKKHGNIQQWISTRTELKYELERNLNCEAFALSNIDSRDFLQKYLEHIHDSKDGSENKTSQRNFVIDSQTNEIAKILDKIDELSSFELNNPLILVMLANMTMNNKTDSSSIVDVTNLYSIYNSIVIQKLRLHRDKGDIVTNEDVLLKSQTDAFQSLHQMLAIKHIFPETDGLNILQPINSNTTNDTVITTINRYGIVFFQSISKFSFVHRTFAEFFVAKYLNDNLIDTTNVYINEKELNSQVRLLEESTYRASIVSDFLYSANGNSRRPRSKDIRCAVTKFILLEHRNNFEFILHFTRIFRSDQQLILEMWGMKKSYFNDCDENTSENSRPIITEQNFNTFYPNQKGQLYFMAWRLSLKLERNFSELLQFNEMNTGEITKLSEFCRFLLETLNEEEIREILIQNDDLMFELYDSYYKYKTSAHTENWKSTLSVLNENDLRLLLLKYAQIYMENYNSYNCLTDQSDDDVTGLVSKLNLKKLNKTMVIQLICPQVDMIMKRIEQKHDFNSSDEKIFQSFYFFKNLTTYDESNEFPSLLLKAMKLYYTFHLATYVEESFELFKNNSNAFEQKLCLSARNIRNETLLYMSLDVFGPAEAIYLIKQYKRVFSHQELIELLTFDFEKFFLKEFSWKSSAKTFQEILNLFIYAFENRTNELIEILIAKKNDGESLFSNFNYNIRFQIEPFLKFLKPHMSALEHERLTMKRAYIDAINDFQANFNASESVKKFLVKYSSILDSNQIYELKDTLLENSKELTNAYSVIEKFFENDFKRQNLNCSTADMFDIHQRLVLNKFLFQYYDFEKFKKFKSVWKKCDNGVRMNENFITHENRDLGEKYEKRPYGGFFVARFFIENIYKPGDNRKHIDEKTRRTIGILIKILSQSINFQKKMFEIFDCGLFFIQEFLEAQDQLKPVPKELTDEFLRTSKNFLKITSLNYHLECFLYEYPHHYRSFSSDIGFIIENFIPNVLKLIKTFFAQNDDILAKLINNEKEIIRKLKEIILRLDVYD
jgi:hypothetical protein